MLRRRIRNTNGVRPDEKGRIRQEKPISHRRSPPQGSARSSRFAGLSRPHARPCPDDRHARAGGSFRNNSVPEDEPMRNFRSNPAQRRDHYQERPTRSSPHSRPDTSLVAAAVGQGRLRRRHVASQRSHRPSLPGHQPLRPRNVAARFRVQRLGAGAAIVRRPRAVGRSAKVRRRRRSISTSR